MPCPVVSLLFIALLLPPRPGSVRAAGTGSESETKGGVKVETIVAAPEGCVERSALGDTVQIHYTGSLEDGRVFDTSLSRDPLQVELGKRQVIPGLEQSLLDMCVGEKRRATIPPHLAYGRRGSPPTIPGDAVLRFDVHLVSLFRPGGSWRLLQRLLPWFCLTLLPALMAPVGIRLYRKRSEERSGRRHRGERRSKGKRK